MRKRAIGLLIAWIALIVIGALLSALHRPKTVALYTAASGGMNIQFPYIAGPHTIDFFTGSGFAAYDTDSQTTKSISPQFILPTVNVVRWSATGVLFEATDYSVVDDLFPALEAKNQPTDQSEQYWWNYDFATQKLNLVLPADLSSTVVDALWNSSEANYCYLTTDGSLYLSNSPQQAIYKTTGSARLKQCGDTTVTLNDGTGLTQIDTTTHNVKTLAHALLQDAYVSPDGQTIAYVVNTHPDSSSVAPGDLYKVNPASGKVRKVLSGFDGVMAGSSGDLYTEYVTNNSAHLELFPKTGKDIVYSLDSSLSKTNAVSQLLPLNPTAVYAVSNTDNLIKLAAQGERRPAPANYAYLIQNDLYENGFEIHYAPQQNTYEIDVTANPYSTYRAAALQYIQTDKIDPNQVKIIWRAGEGVDQVNPHVDNTPVEPLGAGGE